MQTMFRNNITYTISYDSTVIQKFVPVTNENNQLSSNYLNRLACEQEHKIIYGNYDNYVIRCLKICPSNQTFGIFSPMQYRNVSHKEGSDKI